MLKERTENLVKRTEILLCRFTSAFASSVVFLIIQLLYFGIANPIVVWFNLSQLQKIIKKLIKIFNNNVEGQMKKLVYLPMRNTRIKTNRENPRWYFTREVLRTRINNSRELHGIFWRKEKNRSEKC